jgi:hypothetical protein
MALSAARKATVLTTAKNATVLTTAKNAVVSSIMTFITLVPLFVEALGRATEGRPYSPPTVELFPPLYIFDLFAELGLPRHKIVNKGLTSIVEDGGRYRRETATA